MIGGLMIPKNEFKKILVIVMFVGHFMGQDSIAAKTKYKSDGFVRFEVKTFKDDKNRETDDQKIGLSSQLTSKFKRGRLRGRATLTAKAEEAKAGEHYLFVEEAFIMYKKRPWLMKFGFQVFNWTATEVFHPSDIMNAKSISGDDNDQKRGELTFLVQAKVGKGRLNILVMPRFEDPKYPSKFYFNGAGLTIKEPLWWEEKGRVSFDNYGFQGGAFLTQSLGPVDIVLYGVKKRDRSNGILYKSSESDNIHPLFFPVTHFGGTLQWVFGGWNLKAEYDKRKFEGDFARTYTLKDVDYDMLSGSASVFGQKIGVESLSEYDTLALGLEKTISWDGGSETTFILEAQSILSSTKSERADLSVFQRDALLGLRHALNDIMGTEYFLSILKDIEREKEHMITLEYSRRLSDHWKIKLGAKYIEAPMKGTIPQGLEFLHNKNELNMKLTRFF
jgi:hypothetical protein